MLKISTTYLMCYSWDSTLVYFLSSLLPAHLRIFPSQAKSLSSQHPRKPSTTILIKHLAVERPIFVFTNVTNPMEPHFFLPTNQMRALVRFIRGQVAHEKVFCLSWTEAGSNLIILFCSLPCGAKIFEKKCSIFYVFVKSFLLVIDFITVNWVMETT